MITAIDHATPHVPSYHTDFQNVTLASTKANLSFSTTYKFFSTATGMIDFKEESIHSSKEATLYGHAVGPMVILSTANSIVVPSLDLQVSLPSTDTTAVSRADSTAVFVPSMGSKSSDTLVSSMTDLQQNCPTDTNIDSIHCTPGGHYTVLSDPCSTLIDANASTTSRNDFTASSRMVLSATDHTAIGVFTEAQEPRFSAIPTSGVGTEQASAQATKSRGQGNLPIAATEVSSSAVPYQTLEKSQDGDLDGSTIRPYDTAPIVTHPPGISLTPHTTSCTSGTLKPTGLSNTDTWTKSATNGSVSAPSTPPSVPPTFASTGNSATSRCAWVLICLWSMAILHT